MDFRPGGHPLGALPERLADHNPTFSRWRSSTRQEPTSATAASAVCEPRPEDAPVGDWAQVLGELPRRVGEWMERLQREGIRGVDLVFACIGPALEIFSRYGHVETADGREVKLAEYLEKVWEVVGRAALAQVLGGEGGAGALEEDARLTAIFLWTLQSTNGAAAEDAQEGTKDEEEAEDEKDEDETPRRKAEGYVLIFDVVRRFAQPLGIRLPDWEGRIIETHKGVVRLLPIAERAFRLFGKDGAAVVAERLESTRTPSPQQWLFPEMDPATAAKPRGRRGAQIEVADESMTARREATTLDRVHAAMLLQESGRANALRNLLRAEQERGPEFMRLANALSALYPRESEEKRLLDAMLLAMPR
jgi:putative DNA methylase